MVEDFFNQIWPANPSLGTFGVVFAPLVTMLIGAVWAVCFVYAFAHIAPKIAAFARSKRSFQGDKMQEASTDLLINGLVIGGLVLLPTIELEFMRFTGAGEWVDQFMATFWPAYPTLGPLMQTLGPLIVSVLGLLWAGSLVYVMAVFPPKIVALLKGRKRFAADQMEDAVEDMIMNGAALAALVLLSTIIITFIRFAG
jgi:hypothetical protein